LQTTKKKNILVIGHEPAYPLPDIENQRLRHANDCLNQHPENRDKFVKLLQENNVIAYIVGHTHNYSIAKINKLWHVDVGHARGTGDKGARSTFIEVVIDKNGVGYRTFRINSKTGKYEVTDTGSLN
jgi:predicted phosphodiesterase